MFISLGAVLVVVIILLGPAVNRARRALGLAPVLLALALTACGGGDPGSAPTTTAPVVTGPTTTTTIQVGQFCDDADAGRVSSVTVAFFGTVEVRCVYNPASNRNQWVVVSATTTAPPTASTLPVTP